MLTSTTTFRALNRPGLRYRSGGWLFFRSLNERDFNPTKRDFSYPAFFFFAQRTAPSRSAFALAMTTTPFSERLLPQVATSQQGERLFFKSAKAWNRSHELAALFVAIGGGKVEAKTTAPIKALPVMLLPSSC